MGSPPPSPLVDPASTLEDLLRDRWSCRAYLPEPVPHEGIERLLAMAQLAPSWCNSQPWEVLVTEGAGTERFRDALHRAARETPAPTPDIPVPPRYTGVYKERRQEAGLLLYDAVGVARGDREASGRESMRNFDLFGAPHVAVVTVDATLGPYAILDTGIYIGNFLLAARSMGLGAIAQGALALQAAFIRDHFAIPESRLVVAGISFGRPDLAHPVNGYRTSRAAVDDVVTWISA